MTKPNRLSVAEGEQRQRDLGRTQRKRWGHPDDWPFLDAVFAAVHSAREHGLRIAFVCSDNPDVVAQLMHSAEAAADEADAKLVAYELADKGLHRIARMKAESPLVFTDEPLEGGYRCG